MKNFLLLLSLACVLSAADQPGALSAEEKSQGFVPLFNGQTLDGWDGDPRVWSVQDGAIVGSTEGIDLEHNSFLIQKQQYSDFILRVKVKLVSGNSGIQFRSKAAPGWIVSGYQADASDAGERSAWGNLYEERGRGRGLMATPGEGWAKAKNVVNLGDWNEYEIYAKGSRVKLTLNGVLTIDAEDSKASAGVIAFQIHRGPPMEVLFRNVRIKPLN